MDGSNVAQRDKEGCVENSYVAGGTAVGEIITS
jgi:hypothetical protein